MSTSVTPWSTCITRGPGRHQEEIRAPTIAILSRQVDSIKLREALIMQWWVYKGGVGSGEGVTGALTHIIII